MTFHASLTRRCLSPCKALWKLRRACLTSLALALCALLSAALLSSSLQVSWEIQVKFAFFGRGVLDISPLRSIKDSSPSVWGRIPLALLASNSTPVGNDGYVALPIPIAPPVLSCGLFHDVFPAAQH